MRILTVSHFFAAHGGGIELVAGHLSRELAEQGHATLWAAALEDATPVLGATKPIPLPSVNWLERLSGLPMPIPLPRAIGRLWRAVAESDVVIVHDALYASSILAVLAALRHAKPVLLIQHIADIPLPGRLLPRIIRLANRFVAKPMLAAVDQVVFISEPTQRAFALVKVRRPSQLLFNGVDSQLFYPVESPTGHPPRDILFVGRFVPKKGLDVIERLARTRSDLRFTLAGQGPIDPEGWGLPNVRVARGLSGPSLAPLYRAADLLLLPSVGEGYPLVIQEAMASGLPVICGADTARADPAAAAWLTPVHIDLANVAATAKRASAAIDALVFPQRDRLAMAAYATRNYSWSVMARTVARLLEDLSADRR